MPSRISEILAILGSGEDGGSSVYNILAAIFEGLDQRLAVIENVSSSLAALQEQLATSSQGVVDAALAPVLASITARADLGAILTASSVSEQTVGTGTKTFVLAPEASWPMFAPAHILSISAADDPLVYMYGRKVSYDPETGTLVIDVLASAGAGTLSSWTIAPGSLATMASALAVASAGEEITGPTLQIALTQIAEALSARQPLDDNLTALAALTFAANRIIGTGTDGAPDLFPVTAFGKTLLSIASGDLLRTGIGAAPLNSPGLTGTPTAPTAPITSDSNQIVNVTALRTAIANIVNSAPAVLDTFLEFATALGNDPNYATTMATSLSQKLAKADAGLLSGFRNKIINGNFDIWQRGASQSVTGYGSADRWRFVASGSSMAVSRQEFPLGQTDVPGNPKYFCRIAVTTSALASSVAYFHQHIESARTLSGIMATATFYAKADAPKFMTVNVKQYYGTGGPATAPLSIMSKKVAVTTGWQKISVTFDVPTIAGKTLGTNGNDSLLLTFFLDAGSAYSEVDGLGNQSGTFDIARVSVVEGDASGETDPFSPRHIQQELALCQRYFNRLNGPQMLPGFWNGGTQLLGIAQLPVEMRALPSLTASSPLTAFGTQAQSATITSIGLDVVSSRSNIGVSVNCAASSALTADGGALVITTGSYIDLDAEI